MEEINEKLHMQLIDFDSSKRENWVRNRKPFSVLFELTPRCNMNCIHCYLQNNHVCNQLNFEEIIEIIDILYDKGILFLTFTGGEVFTRKDFIDIYLYAKKRGFLVEVFTNGYSINDDIINIFKEYPPLLVDISLYGANEDTYYKVTGIHNAFEKVINNCKRLKDANIRTFLKSPIIKPTLSEIDDMKVLADKIGVQFIYTFEICSTIDGNNGPKNLQVDLSDALKYEFKNFYDQVEKGERNLREDHTDVINDFLNDKHIFTCNVALNSFVIDYQGNFCPCMKLRHKGIKLNKDNFDKIWQEFEIFSQLKASKDYVCKKCKAKYFCDVCPGEMDFLYNDMEYRPEHVCISAKIRKKFYEGEISFDEAIEIADSNECE